jgi:signal transduction histidine kinase
MMSENKPAVLMVDDVEANLIALEGQLERLGYDLVRARSGNEALKLLLRREFAVMLLDVQMPEMDGYEAARHARANPASRELPIIFVTAMGPSEKNELSGYDAGAVDYLFKPINPEILRSKVRVFVELYVARRRLADEIAAHKQTLAELESFNYSVSHDLRAPLLPIEGFCDLLLEKHDLDPQAQKHVQSIRSSAKHMTGLIEDFLQLAQVRKVEIDEHGVELQEIADDVLRQLRLREPTRQVEFMSSSARVAGDGRLLRIAFENLLRNAWKFSRQRSPALIEFGRQIEGGRPVYFVRDNGAGFDPSRAKRLFQPFQRLHTKAEFDGTGIGLAIVQRIISRHDGHIWAEASPDHGATFFFTLHDGQNARG